MTALDPINAILTHPLYQQELAHIRQAEQQRPYCRHTLEHFLDVARLLYIHTLENHLPYSRTLLYATALLHDIGRAHPDHHLASASLARTILTDCRFSPTDITLITTAITHHRDPHTTDPLSHLLYHADKTSRLCFLCPAQPDCNWPLTKQNHTLTY